MHVAMFFNLLICFFFQPLLQRRPTNRRVWTMKMRRMKRRQNPQQRRRSKRRKMNPRLTLSLRKITSGSRGIPKAAETPPPIVTLHGRGTTPTAKALHSRVKQARVTRRARAAVLGRAGIVWGTTARLTIRLALYLAPGAPLQISL